jgi:hypothetical protein
MGKAVKFGGLRPLLLALGLGLYWFVEHPDAAEVEAPMWGYLTVAGLRLLTDIIGAWFAISALRLVLALAGLGWTYLRTLWPQEG